MTKPSLSAAARFYRRTGALWMEDLFPQTLIRRVAKHYADNYSRLSTQELEQRHACVGDRRYMITAAIKGALNSSKLYANKRVIGLMNELLGPRFLISSFGSVIAFPGADAQSVHFDYPPLFEDPVVCSELPPHAITLVVPLVDITPETGSTAIWLGTHNKVDSRDRLRELYESGSIVGSVMPEPKLGDAFLMDFRTIHAGTPNISDAPRPILYIVYSRNWFREDMNFDEQPPINLSAKQMLKVPKKWRYLFSTAQNTGA